RTRCELDHRLFPTRRSSDLKREVKKIRYCGDIRMGYRLFVCEGCNNTKHIPLKCKGKFCPTCAAGESQKWAATTANDLFSVIHRSEEHTSELQSRFDLVCRL